MSRVGRRAARARVAAAALGLSLALASSPAGASPCPEWARGKFPAEYPSSRYFVGLGVAGGVWSADRGEEPGRVKAFGEIANQLRASVSSTTQIRDLESTGGRKETSVKEDATISSKLVLQGARVVARCFEAESTTFYALAVVDRAEAAVRVGTEIDGLNKRGALELAAAQEKVAAKDPLAGVTHLRAALDAWSGWGVQSSLFIALTGKPGGEAFTSSAQLTELQEALRKQTLVSVDVTDADGFLRRAIQSKLSENRIVTAQGPSKPFLAVTGKVEVIDIGASSFGATIARVRVTVDVTRTDDGTIVSSVTEEGRGGGASADDARRKAVTTAVDKATPKINAVLVRLLVAKT